MARIIEQLQKDALDPTVSVSALLRRVKLAATKLGLPAVEDWVEKELNGYTTPVPDYRMVRGRPMARNPYVGWMPIGGSVELLSKRSNGQSIAALEDMINNGDKETTFHTRFPDRVCEKLDEMNGVRGWNYALEISRSQLVAIVDRVRNLVLDWALNLEKAGVFGSEFAFDAVEKQKAQAVPMINIGSIGSFSGNLGTGNVSGNISATDVNVTQVRELLGHLQGAIGELSAAGVDRSNLEQRLATLEAEAKKATPDYSLLRRMLTDIRSSLYAVAGSAAASGAIKLLNQILGVPTP
jgi:AbiTii